MNYILITVVVTTVANHVVIGSVSSTQRPRQKESPVFEKCSSDFLWRALLAAGHGNSSASHFLNSSLDELGFTSTGIQARSIASAWMKQMKHVSSESVFSQLQIWSATPTQTRNATDNSRFKTSTELPLLDENLVPTLPPATSAKWNPPKSLKKRIRTAIKSISKLYNDETLPSLEQKKKRKKLRRLLKAFLREQQQLECGSEIEFDSKNPSTRVKRSKNKKPKKKKQGPKDAIKICLLMISELVTRGICDEVEESFKLAFDEVQKKYLYDMEGKGRWKKQTEQTFGQVVVVAPSNENPAHGEN